MVVWARSGKGRLGSQRGGHMGPGTGVLGGGQPGGFPNLACKGLGKAPGACQHGTSVGQGGN